MSFRFLRSLVMALMMVSLLAACGSDDEVMILPTVGVPSGTPLLTVLPPDEDTSVASGAGCTPTEADQEGPYYVEGAPFREQLAPADAGGDRLIINGRVYLYTSTGCQPLSGAVIDVWQVGLNGEYDLSDQFLYRGKVETDADGSYRFETVMPPPYEGRPAHVHLKIDHPDAQSLTTQLYFEGDAALQGATNQDSPRILRVSSEDGALSGSFDIVLSGK